MDNKYNSKSLKKYNSNKIKLNSSQPDNIKVEQSKENSKQSPSQEELKTNEFLLNGMCRVCNLQDRTCRCLRFSKNSTPRICYCGNKECDFDCGVLACGCIDVCRKHRSDYDDCY